MSSRTDFSQHTYFRREILLSSFMVPDVGRPARVSSSQPFSKFDKSEVTAASRADSQAKRKFGQLEIRSSCIGASCGTNLQDDMPLIGPPLQLPSSYICVSYVTHHGWFTVTAVPLPHFQSQPQLYPIDRGSKFPAIRKPQDVDPYRLYQL